MRYLSSDNDNRIIYVIPQTQQVIIGRSVDNQICNFAIPDDPSISRKHATLTISDNNLVLQDLGSRYGTFLNNSSEKAEINTDIQLKENDIIKFGKMNSIWKVNILSLNTCTSTLKGENLQKLKQTLSKVGGVLKNEWDDSCNYLTMPAITLTIKVVLALIQGSHIVTTEFWSAFHESVTNFAAMPDPLKFMPAIVESTLNKEVVSFLPNPSRKSVFKNKKFVFFSRRQFEMYKPVLTASGATTLLLGESKMTVSMLCEPNVIVIQYAATGATQETQAQKNQVNEIITQLKSKGKRVIADAEIGLAILYCSTDKYCNPNFSFTSEVVKQTSGPISIHSKILAQESQEPAISRHEKENVKINETYASDDKHNFDLSVDKQNAKRKLSEITSEVQSNPNKKIATFSSEAHLTKESTKRRLSEEDLSSNASKKMALDNDDQGASNSSDDLLAGRDKPEDLFNFINPVSNNNGSGKKTLNLSKPQKRKIEASRDDDNIFNFVQAEDETQISEDTSKQSIFSSNKVKKTDDTPDIKNAVSITPEDISAMRGVKLKELMQNTNNSSLQDCNSIKQERTEELEEKMGSLYLGNTIVVICNNLIVKKEPVNIESDDSTSSVKNFKKFKKVWPVRKQATIIPSSSMNIADLTDSNTYSVAF